MTAYEALARKKRPRNFEQMVGQEHVLQALTNALSQNRLHHAYLFTGTRGVGKTTLARIFAKSLNCEKGITATPCGQCTICQQIDAGRCLDLIEIDAASRTKVEDTRDLLDSVQYAPHQTRYKIYVIDEVHMLSNHSFNALLKTLEEPPPHTKFILATTDPQKIPITVLSRCLQFHLKHLSKQQITNHLKFILDEEKIIYEETALKSIAKAAEGSMRDALSLLDQAIAFCQNEITLSKVDRLLGSISTIYFYQLVDTLCRKNATELFQVIDTIAQHTADFGQILEELLTVLHQMAVTQSVPGFISDFTDSNKLNKWIEQLTPEEIQLFYQIALIGRRDLPLAPSPQIGFEMVLLRMLFFSQKKVEISLPENLTSSFSPSLRARVAGEATQTDTWIATAASLPRNDGENGGKETHNWSEILEQLNLTGITKTLASYCVLKEITESHIYLALDPDQIILLNEKQRERLEQALNDFFAVPRKLIIETNTSDTLSPALAEKAHKEQLHQTAVENMMRDPNVQTILESFNTQLLPENVKLL